MNRHVWLLQAEGATLAASQIAFISSSLTGLESYDRTERLAVNISSDIPGNLNLHDILIDNDNLKLGINLES